MTRIIAPLGLIFLAACATDIVSVDAGSNLASADAPLDADCDGFSVDEDCDDNDASVYPGAVDVCDEKDNDCDPAVAYGENGEVIPTSFGEPDLCVDHDGDSWTLGEDCDDADADVYPGALETDNDVDDDCDGEIDEGYDSEPVDSDGDGYTEADGDCDDTNAFVHPGAVEICGNDVDENCDGIAEDMDGDGNLTSGSHPDCDDNDAAVYYGATEVENGIDDDCDGMIDEGTDTGPVPNDADGDGYEDHVDCDDTDATVHPGAAEVVGDGIDQDCNGTDLIDEDCDGYTATVDCDDTDAWVHPGALESDNGIDDDCDGLTDEDFDTEPVDADADGDGYTETEDCDDNDASVNPGATEVCGDGLDNDCSGSDASCGSPDADGDGYIATVDCDDSDSAINPAASEYNAGLDDEDNDCDGSVDEDWQAMVFVEYPSSGYYVLNAGFYTSGSAPNALGWTETDTESSGTDMSVEFTTSEYGDMSTSCGLIINVNEGNPASSWLCENWEVDSTVMVDAWFDGVWYDETDIAEWIANDSTGSCAAILHVSSASSCTPVDDT